MIVEKGLDEQLRVSERGSDPGKHLVGNGEQQMTSAQDRFRRIGEEVGDQLEAVADRVLKEVDDRFEQLVGVVDEDQISRARR